MLIYNVTPAVQDYIPYLLAWLYFGIILAPKEDMDEYANEKEKEVSELTKFSGKMLKGIGAVIIALAGVSGVWKEPLLGFLSHYKPIMAVPFIFILLALIFFFWSYIISQKTTKAPETEDIIEYLIRRKSKLNILGLVFVIIGFFILIIYIIGYFF